MSDTERRSVRYPLARPAADTGYLIVPYRVARAYARLPAYRLSLPTVAELSGVHPDLVRRFAALGLLDAERDATGEPWFTAAAPADIARIQRLRAGLSLNYAAIGLVLDLLDRINRLERALRTGTPVPIGAGTVVLTRGGATSAARSRSRQPSRQQGGQRSRRKPGSQPHGDSGPPGDSEQPRSDQTWT